MHNPRGVVEKHIISSTLTVRELCAFERPYEIKPMATHITQTRVWKQELNGGTRHTRTLSIIHGSNETHATRFTFVRRFDLGTRRT